MGEEKYVDVSQHRPDTEDAALMSRLITTLLTLGADCDGLPTHLLDTEVDDETLTYMAMVRSSTIANGTGMGSGIREVASVSVAWVEGFLMGAKFAEEKRRESEQT